MDDCCTVPQADDRDAASQVVAERECPECGARGKGVDIVTLEHLLNPAALGRLDRDASFRFCATPDCDVVYFAAGRKPFHQADLTVRVGLKVKEPPVPVCYCFGFTKADIAAQLAATGQSTIAREITARVKAGECACEIKNPQGSCCLGNVAMATKRLAAQVRAQNPA